MIAAAVSSIERRDTSMIGNGVFTPVSISLVPQRGQTPLWDNSKPWQETIST